MPQRKCLSPTTYHATYASRHANSKSFDKIRQMLVSLTSFKSTLLKSQMIHLYELVNVKQLVQSDSHQLVQIKVTLTNSHKVTLINSYKVSLINSSEVHEGCEFRSPTQRITVTHVEASHSSASNVCRSRCVELNSASSEPVHTDTGSTLVCPSSTLQPRVARAASDELWFALVAADSSDEDGDYEYQPAKRYHKLATRIKDTRRSACHRF